MTFASDRRTCSLATAASVTAAQANNVMIGVILHGLVVILLCSITVMSSYTRHFRTEEVAESDRLGKIVHFVAVLPIDPHVLNADVAPVVRLLHRAKDSGVVDRVLLERGLQPTLARAAGMEVRGVRDQRFHSAVRHPAAGEMRVVECKGQAGHAAHKTKRLFRLRHDGTHVGLDAEDDTLLPGLLDPPRELVAAALPGVGRFFAIETNTWQRGDMPGTAGRGV